MSEGLIGFLIGCAIFATLALLGVGISSIAWHAEHVDCLRLSEQTSYPTRMVGTAFGGGCFIWIDGRWIPDSRYRLVDVDDN